MLPLNWRQCGADQHWCDFLTTDISITPFSQLEGVYVIWHEGAPPEVIRVGQGNIRARIATHRNDPAIIAFRDRGPLYVTWASVDENDLPGVERYLMETIRPLQRDPATDAEPIEVNLPRRWMRAAPHKG